MFWIIFVCLFGGQPYGKCSCFPVDSSNCVQITKLEERIGSVVERVIVCSQLARILKSKRIIRSLTFRALIVVLSIKLKDQKVIFSLDHLELFRPAVNVQQI